METTFTAELWQAGKAWVAGTYTKLNLWTLDDLRQAVTTRKNFWIPGKWDRRNYWVFGSLFLYYFFLLIFWQILLSPWTISIPLIGILIWFMRYRRQILRQFIAFGPRGVLYQDKAVSKHFLWADLKQIYILWKMPLLLDEGPHDMYCEHKLHCISHAGTEFDIRYSDKDFNRDEVKSFDVLRDLFEMYWGQKVLHKFPPGVL